MLNVTSLLYNESDSTGRLQVQIQGPIERRRRADDGVRTLTLDILDVTSRYFVHCQFSAKVCAPVLEGGEKNVPIDGTFGVTGCKK